MEIDLRNRRSESLSKPIQKTAAGLSLESFDFLLKQVEEGDLPDQGSGVSLPFSQMKTQEGESQGSTPEIADQKKSEVAEKKSGELLQSQTQDSFLKGIHPLLHSVSQTTTPVVPFWIVVRDRLVDAVAKMKDVKTHETHVEIRDPDLGSMDFQIQENGGDLKISMKVDSELYGLLSGKCDHMAEHLKKKFQYHHVEVTVTPGSFSESHDQDRRDRGSSDQNQEDDVSR